ncbi:hypothetical protein AB0N88_04090 [Streptomyces sp. NPDC093516]|uniref:hypothetical protein n=1 Tax=Streptomyces sp. NPDC093516 TaxID=3155304 RepID=UPI00342B8416
MGVPRPGGVERELPPTPRADPPGPPPPHGHLRRSPRAPTPAHTHEVTIARCQGPDAPRALVEVKVKVVVVKVVVVTETW